MSLLLAAGLFAVASPAAAIERTQFLHTTPPAIPHPLPQGAPVLVVNGPSHAPVELRYAEVNGERVLLDARTGRIVYLLRP